MKILIDMNLSPDWVTVLNGASHEAVHWSAVGDARAPDAEILAYARGNGQVLFTHDLDFALILAFTKSTGPSVVQVRTHDVLPSSIGKLITTVLQNHEAELLQGALVSVDESTARVRILPIK